MKKYMSTLLVMIVCSAVQTAILPQMPSEIAAAVEKARAQPDSVLVLIDAKDHYFVIPVTGISAVRDRAITVKANTYSIGDATGDYGLEEIADKLLSTFFGRVPPGNRFGAIDRDGKMLEGDIGATKSETTIEVKRILKTGKKPTA